MLNLLLVGMFTAFFSVLIEPIKDLLTIVITRRAINGFFFLLFSFLGTIILEPNFNTKLIVKVSAGAFFLLFSFLGTIILEPNFNTKLIVKVSAGAFLGSFLIILSERLSTYQAAVIRAVGQDR